MKQTKKKNSVDHVTERHKQPELLQPRESKPDIPNDSLTVMLTTTLPPAEQHAT